MTDAATAADDWLASLAAGPAARQPATLPEILGAAWQGAGTSTMTGLPLLAREAYGELTDALHAETGMSDAEFTGNWGGGGIPLAEVDRAALIEQNLGTLDKEGRDRIAPLVDIRKRASEKAAASEAEAANVASRTHGLSGTALAFLAGTARQVLDPINLASSVVGGPLKGPVLKMLLREAAIGGGVTAFEEPAIETERKALGLAPGDFFDNVIGGAIGSAGFSLALRGAGAALRFARGVGARSETFVRTSPDGPFVALARGVSEDDFAAAASVAERDALIAGRATPATPRGRAAMPEKLDVAAAALERGKPSETPLFPEIASEPSRPQTYLGEDQIARPNGDVLTVKPRVVELSDLVVSHDLEGKPNPNYPQELQGRDRSAAASRSYVAEKAAALEPIRLGRSPTAQEGAPVIGPDGVVESGNGRVMMIARAYDRHPERAAAYRAFVESQGFPTEGMKQPVLVRGRETPVADRAAFAREANVPSTAGLSTVERAIADAGRLSDELLGMRVAGETGSLANVKFVRAFADRVVAPEERPNFVSSDNRLSAEGATRIEAALTARGWGDKEIVAALYEQRDPTSRAILGALADSAPAAARVKAEIAAGRLDAKLDPAPAIVAGLRLVDRARQSGQKVGDLIDQVDIETGAVPDAVRAAVKLFFRDDAYRVAAGRDWVAARLDKTLAATLDRTKAVGDLFGFEADAASLLREGWTAETPVDDISLEGAPAEAAAGSGQPAAAAEAAGETKLPGDPALRADAGRALEEAGGDVEIFLVDAAGNQTKISARQALQEAEEDAAAQRELVDCIGMTGAAA